MQTVRLTLPCALLLVLLFGSHCSFAPDSTPVMNTPPPLSDWSQYRNDIFHFQFDYPSGGRLTETPNHANAVIDLPPSISSSGRNVSLLVNATSGQSECSSPIARASALQPGEFAGEPVEVSGNTFLKQEGDACGSNCTYWDSYSSARESTCVTITLVVGYTRLSEPPAPATLDVHSESDILRQVLMKFRWTN